MSTSNSTEESKSPPEKVFELGSVCASVFVNQGQKGPFRSIKLDRRYRTEDGRWHSSSTFTAQQLAVAISIAQEALAFVIGREEAEGE